MWTVSEKSYLKSRGTERSRLLNQFRSDQKIFDRQYRKTERSYKFRTLIEIDESCKNDHKKFWDMLKRLGPRKTKQIPNEIIDAHGDVINDTRAVLDKWRSDYENLYTFQPQPGEFDDDHYNLIKNTGANPHQDELQYNINYDITDEEVKQVVKEAKLNKAVGIDNLPNEILKSPASIKVLTRLFKKVFQSGIIPTCWKYGILKPIPKSSLNDLRDPLQYRAISLLSTVYKLFSSIINKRIVKVCEENNIFADEQNGFRRERACVDHIFSLTSIIRNRKNKRLPTYAAYIDFEKAFDRIGRTLLFHKIQKLGFGGKITELIKNIYKGGKCGVNVNGNITNWFPCEYGVRQGDVLSPTLFGLYINDLVQELKDGSSGINLGELIVVCLLYADDLVLVSESPEDLQKMLDILNNWCKRWRLRVNISKSKLFTTETKVNQEVTSNLNWAI